ncbi:MAG TPA: tRNA (adenosine(37)-N6)-dimethylallyltransferase MiaA [Candidatus Acidoferrales bacterium]|nr:tRNA (adenosine(37)-N6)-dimethylallyltransferase MiaA [Candidatus Acidoferrales bacterium]
MSAERRLLVILGPTASGKSTLAVELALKLGGEVVCCDSTQIYRHFDIGTGKLPVAEQKGIPHHLTDLAEPEDVFTAGDYRRHALQALGDISARGKLPILTVGTGLYLRALLEGLDDLPGRSEAVRERLRQRAAARGAEYLHRILVKCDPAGAAQIALRDTQKIIRAIEVCFLTGKPASELRGRNRTGLTGFHVLKIGLMPPREQLYAQIDRRVETMFQSGWVEEVRGLTHRGVPPNAKPFTFLGYGQIREHIASPAPRPLDAIVPEIQQATRQYAKRQITWFRREAEVHWLASFGHDVKIQREALEIARPQG